MVLVDTETVCDVCGSDLVINGRPELKDTLGVCDECGLPYRIDGSIESGTVRNPEPTMDGGEVDRPIIKEYYEQTGEPACTVVYCERSESEINAFCDWANENYGGYWGMTLEEIWDEKGTSERSE